jgi:hypothetical protein
MKTLIRHSLVALLPLVCGIAAGYGFAYRARRTSCTALVGPLFAAKCHGRELEYQLLFQTGGTAGGTVLAAALGAWLEHRRRRAVQPPAQQPGE